MTEKNCLATLKNLLTPKEMKNVLGGTGVTGSYSCYCACCPNFTVPIWASNCEGALKQLTNGCTQAGGSGGCDDC